MKVPRNRDNVERHLRISLITFKDTTCIDDDAEAIERRIAESDDKNQRSNRKELCRWYRISEYRNRNTTFITRASTQTHAIRAETDPYELFAVGELLGPGYASHEGLYSGSSHVSAKEEKRESHVESRREEERNSREELVTSHRGE